MGMDDTTSDGRMWAAIAWGSAFVGIPLGIVPLAQRNDAFALHHAKQAVAVQLTFFAAYMLTFVLAFVFFFLTCGMSHLLFIPLLMLMLVWPIGTGLHGILLAMNGDWAYPMTTGDLGERIFSNVVLDEAAVAQKAGVPGRPPAADAVEVEDASNDEEG